MRSYLLAAMLLSIIQSPSWAASSAPKGHESARQSPTQEGQRQEAGKDRYGSTAQAPLLVEIVEKHEDSARRHTREQEANKDQDRERQAQDSRDRLSALTAIASAIGTIFLLLTLVYTARAANAAKRSADQAENALKHTVSSAEAAVQMADAAERSLALTAEQFKAAHRPVLYASVAFGHVKDNWSTDLDTGVAKFYKTGLAILANITNSGTAPANNVRIMTQVRVVDFGAEPNFDDPNQNISDTSFSLAPGPNTVLTTDATYLTVEETELARLRTHDIIYRVDVFYTDALNQSSFLTTMLGRLELLAPLHVYAAGNTAAVTMKAWGKSQIT